MKGGIEKETPRGLVRRARVPLFEKGRGADRHLASAGARMSEMEVEGDQGAGGKDAQAS